MARSTGNNLTIQISADATKLKADLELVKSELRALQKEISRAADASRKSGDTRPLLALTRQYEILTVTLREYNKALGDVNRSHIAAVPAARNLNSALGGMGSGIADVVGAARGLRAGLIGFAVIEGARRVGEAVNDMVEKVLDLRKISIATDIEPQFIQVFQNAIKSAGADAADAAKLLFNLSTSFQQARMDAERAGTAIGTNMRVLRGDTKDLTSQMVILQNTASTTRTAMVKVMRGNTLLAPPVIKDAASAYEALGINVAKYTAEQVKQGQVVVDVAVGLQKWKDAGRVDVATQAGLQIYQARFREIAAALEDIAKNAPAIRKAMQGTGQILSNEEIAAVRRLQEVRDTLGDVQEGAATRTFVVGLPALQRASEDQLAAMREMNKLPREIAQAWTDMGTAISTGASRVSTNITDAFAPLGPWFSNLSAQIAAKWNADMSTLAMPPGAAWPAPVFGAIPGNAAGGLISGPGSGTSDSILARLSTGEFVMRATAVRKWGAGLLAAMNAAGSAPFVQRSRRGFADGGLVTAGAGTPVHLHLGGQSFALSGGADVVESLVHAAHRHKIRSAGVKPSWYGGTPGGR